MLGADSDAPLPDPMHAPPIEKQPEFKLIPLLNVDDALEDVTLSTGNCTPPEKLEVALPVEVMTPPVVMSVLIVVAALAIVPVASAATTNTTNCNALLRERNFLYILSGYD